MSKFFSFIDIPCFNLVNFSHDSALKGQNDTLYMQKNYTHMYIHTYIHAFLLSADRSKYPVAISSPNSQYFTEFPSLMHLTIVSLHHTKVFTRDPFYKCGINQSNTHLYYLPLAVLLLLYYLAF